AAALRRHPQMPAAVANELEQRTEVDARLFGDRSRDVRFEELSAVTSRRFRRHLAALFGDGDESVGARTDVRILRNEAAVHRDPRNLDLQPAAERHPLASVARHVHQHALDPLHGYIDDDRPRRAREYQLDILARNQLEDGLQAVQYLVDVDRFEPAGLLLAVRRQLPQETRGTGDLAEQPFAVRPQRRIAVA